MDGNNRGRLNLPLTAKVASACLIVFAAILGASGRIASAEMVTGTCPAGHFRQVIFGSTSLYIDGQWPVSYHTSVQDDDHCSGAPFIGGIIYFRDLNTALVQEMNRRGVRFEWLRLDMTPPRVVPDPALIPSAPEARLVVPSGTIEDITETKRATLPLNPDSRLYRLQHRTAEGTLGPPFMVRCGNLGSRRLCSTKYGYSSDIVVVYSFQQDGINHPAKHYGIVPGTFPEPDSFLELDARLREWIADMHKQPK